MIKIILHKDYIEISGNDNQSREARECYARIDTATSIFYSLNSVQLDQDSGYYKISELSGANNRFLHVYKNHLIDLKTKYPSAVMVVERG